MKIAELEALAQDYEEAARAIRVTIAAFNGAAALRHHLHKQTKAAANGKLHVAIAHEAARNGHDGAQNQRPPKDSKHRTGFLFAVQEVLRAQDGPIEKPALRDAMVAKGFRDLLGMAGAIRYNYVRKTAKGYVLGKDVARPRAEQ